MRPKCEESLIILACIRWNILTIWPFLFSSFFFSKQYLKVNMKRFDAKEFCQIKMKMEDEFSVACSCCEIFLFWWKFYYLRTSVCSLCNIHCSSVWGSWMRCRPREELMMWNATTQSYGSQIPGICPFGWVRPCCSRRKKSTKSVHKCKLCPPF